MKKVRCDSKLAGLSATRLAKIDDWYFEQNLGHEEVHRRVVEKFQFTGSVSGLKRYYARRKVERTIDELLELREAAEHIEQDRDDAEVLKTSAMQLFAAQLFKLAQEQKPQDALAIARVLISHESVTLRREQWQAKVDREAELKEGRKGLSVMWDAMFGSPTPVPPRPTPKPLNVHIPTPPGEPQATAKPAKST